MLRITVLGSGYVGLVSGICLAELGHRIICADKDVAKIKTLQERKLPIQEDGLLTLLKKNVEAGRLNFSHEIDRTIHDSDVIMIAVGTPLTDCGRFNMDYVHDCIAKIAKHASRDVLVIIKSTVLVGTCDQAQAYLDETSKFNCIVASNPEFLREGSAVHDFMNPDRILVGTDGRGIELINRLYAKQVEHGAPIVHTDRRTAELIKYAANTFLAMKVGFINEISDISQRAGCDMQLLIEGIGSDKRIGREFLKPGPGFGGSCFPKDVKGLVDSAEALGVELPIIKSILKSNVLRTHNIAKTIKAKLQPGETIAVLGLTYKANTDDTRDSPAISVVKLLLQDGNHPIRAFDPAGMKNAAKILGTANVRGGTVVCAEIVDEFGVCTQMSTGGITYCHDALDACEGASLVVVLTEWSCFRDLDAARLKNVMKKPRIYDLRSVIDRENFVRHGFSVRVIGYGIDRMKEQAGASA